MMYRKMLFAGILIVFFTTLSLSTIGFSSTSHELNILNAQNFLDTRMDRALALFAARHPDVEVRFVDVERENLTIDLLSGEHDYDIICMDYQSTGNFLRAGLIANLADYESIRQSMASWAEIGCLYQTDGTLLCVPFFVDPFGFSVNQPLLERLAVALPADDWNYADFARQAQQVREQDAYLLNLPAWLQFPLYTYDAQNNDFAAGVMRYDTPAFRERMTYWKDLIDRDLVLVTNSPFEKPENTLFSVDYVYYLDFLNGRAILPPGGSAYANVAGMFLYEHGAKKELAADFLALYASAEVQRKLPYPDGIVLADIRQYDQYEKWVEAGLVPQDAQNTAWYKLLAESRMMQVDFDLRKTAITEIAAYTAGGKELDQLISALNRQADMILHE